MKKQRELPEMPFYCKECGLCKTDKQAYDNLKVVDNTGYTRNIYCLELKEKVYGT